MKGTEALVIGAGALELHVLADDLHDVRALPDLGDDLFGDQTCHVLGVATFEVAGHA